MVVLTGPLGMNDWTGMGALALRSDLSRNTLAIKDLEVMVLDLMLTVLG